MEADKTTSKGVLPQEQKEKLCVVCGDRASGYHYNALTCDCCKEFFWRSITKNLTYQCKYDNDCKIDKYTRKKCKECRLQKCFSVGMKAFGMKAKRVVPGYQCPQRYERKEENKDRKRDMGSDKEDDPPPTMQQQVLSKAQEGLISRLLAYQEQYESPSENDLQKITAFPPGDSEEDSLKRFQHITEITILTVHLIVEFSNRVPGFDTLFTEDQITLLKACSSEVMMLRTARKYDPTTDSIVFANNLPYTRENFCNAFLGDSADSIFKFCRDTSSLRVDSAEYALMTAIVLFTERPGLMEPKKVEKVRKLYAEMLRVYILTNRPLVENHFERLLSTLSELRTLRKLNFDLCFSLKAQNKKLPAFLEEIWDIQQ